MFINLSIDWKKYPEIDFLYSSIHIWYCLCFIQEFQLIAEIVNDLEKEKIEKLEMVRKETAWEQEKYRIGLYKIKSK